MWLLQITQGQYAFYSAAKYTHSHILLNRKEKDDEEHHRQTTYLHMLINPLGVKAMWKCLSRMPFHFSENESIKIHLYSNCGKVTTLRHPATKKQAHIKMKCWDVDLNAFQ